MGKITTGNSFGVTAKQAQAMRLLAEGELSEQRIIRIIFPVNRQKEDGTWEEDPKLYRKYRTIFSKWKRDPKCQECYRAIVAEIAFGDFSHSMARMRQQVDSNDPWLAQNAARDTLNRWQSKVMGEESADTVIRIEGMPALGTPEGIVNDGGGDG